MHDKDQWIHHDLRHGGERRCIVKGETAHKAGIRRVRRRVGQQRASICGGLRNDGGTDRTRGPTPVLNNDRLSENLLHRARN